MQTKTEIQCSMNKTDHHLRWAAGNQSAMEFRATLPGYTEEERAEMKRSAAWFAEQAASAKRQIESLAQALQFAA